MSYTAKIVWTRSDPGFTDLKYNRRHEWSFDGGLTVPASASPHVVRAPWSDPAAVDPEEAFVAALSSCHMLWFLALAAKGGFVVDSYQDEARGELGKNAEGRDAMTEVVLRPHVRFSGRAPGSEELNRLHEEAHTRCYIANSVKSSVRVEPG